MIQHRSEDLFERALSLIPGGVNSPVRAWSAVGGSPRFVASGRGARIVDVDGRSYIDYMGSWGPLILGHVHPAIVEAVHSALQDGTSFGAPTEGELVLAERIVAAVPSIELVRLVSSGTEATMSALRLARAATGRETIIKFAGCYHGHADALLVRAGSAATTLGVPDSPGITVAAAAAMRVARFNDLASVEALCNEQTAAIIVEPVAGNMGVIAPREDFLVGLRKLADQSGALLVFDEVITGFRLSLGGYQAIAGVLPDLTCLGKIIGGGLPVGAYGGRADLMERIAPSGPVYQAGTLSGNPLAVAAGAAMLEHLATTDPYAELDRRARRLQVGLEEALGDRPGCVQRVGSMLTLFFGKASVSDYDDALQLDTERFAAFFRAVVDEGIWIPPAQYEAWFVSTAHSDDDIDATLEAVTRAIVASD